MVCPVEQLCRFSFRQCVSADLHYSLQDCDRCQGPRLQRLCSLYMYRKTGLYRRAKMALPFHYLKLIYEGFPRYSSAALAPIHDTATPSDSQLETLPDVDLNRDLEGLERCFRACILVGKVFRCLVVDECHQYVQCVVVHLVK